MEVKVEAFLGEKSGHRPKKTPGKSKSKSLAKLK